MYLSPFAIIKYIRDSIDVIAKIRADEMLVDYKTDLKENLAECYEILLQKSEDSVRHHIAVENKLKIEYEILNDKFTEVENENKKLKSDIKSLEESKQEDKKKFNKQILNLTNLNTNIQNKEKKLRKKLDIKDKEIFQLQTKINSLNNEIKQKYNNIGLYTNKNKIFKNNFNSSFLNKEDYLKDCQKLKNNENIETTTMDDIQNKVFKSISLNNKGRNHNTIRSLYSNSVHHLNHYNSCNKINNISSIISEKDNLNLENKYIMNYDFTTLASNKSRSNIKILNNPLYSNKYSHFFNTGDMVKMKSKIKLKSKIEDPLDKSIQKVKDTKATIILENFNNFNYISSNKPINTLKPEKKGTSRKANEQTILMNSQKTNKVKRTFSSTNKNNNSRNNINFNQMNSLHNSKNHKKEKTLTKKSEIMKNHPLKLHQNINNNFIYFIKKSPNKMSYKNSMPNIKGLNINKKKSREINKKQFLSNKANPNQNYINNSRNTSVKFKELKKNESSFNFNNTNIINNKIFKKEEKINNNIFIINRVDENSHKNNYPFISINQNHISVKKVSLKTPKKK